MITYEQYRIINFWKYKNKQIRTLSIENKNKEDLIKELDDIIKQFL